jgi:hypothetical protein
VHGCGWATLLVLSGPWCQAANGSRLCNPDHGLSTSAAMAVSPVLARQDAGAQLWSDDRLVAPDRGFHETAPLQASFVGRPIMDPIAGLRDAVTTSGIVLERHARDRNGSAATGPPAPAPSGSLHQRRRESPSAFESHEAGRILGKRGQERPKPRRPCHNTRIFLLTSSVRPERIAFRAPRDSDGGRGDCRQRSRFPRNPSSRYYLPSSSQKAGFSQQSTEQWQDEPDYR